MSEAQSTEEKATPSNAEAMAEMLNLIGRLASLKAGGELGHLVEAPLDALLTSEQAALWLQCSVTSLNDDAKHNKIPAIPRRNQWRFHPRTILEEAHRRFHKNK